MSRSRNIKPGFFKNEDLAECSPWARLCFAGLWTIADREGRLEDRPKRIKGDLFAFDSIEVDPLLDELQQYHFITRYEVGGRRFIQILEFSKHQNPHHKEAQSVIPSPKSPGLSTHAIDVKPETQPALNEGEAPDKPETSPGLSPQHMQIHDPKTVLIPSSLIPDSRKEREKTTAVEIDTWIRTLDGEDAIPGDDSIFSWAEKTGIPLDYLALSWITFRDDMRERHKRQKDWRAHYRNAVKRNWYKLWWFDPTGECKLTTTGEQAKRAAA